MSSDSDTAYVMPGQVWFGAAPGTVSTLLGSCVAVTLWHPGRRRGGLCHFMLPRRAEGETGGALDGRYGDEALDLLLRAAQRAGCPPQECEAKLFGGGRMFQSVRAGGAIDVQQRNVEQVRALALRHQLQVRATHLGGDGHRLLRLDIATGDVWLRFTPLVEAA